MDPIEYVWPNRPKAGAESFSVEISAGIYCPPPTDFFKALILFFGPVEILGPKFRRALTSDWPGEFGPNFQDLVGSPTGTKALNKIRDMGVA